MSKQADRVLGVVRAYVEDLETINRDTLEAALEEAVDECILEGLILPYGELNE